MSEADRSWQGGRANRHLWTCVSHFYDWVDLAMASVVVAFAVREHLPSILSFLLWFFLPDQHGLLRDIVDKLVALQLSEMEESGKEGNVSENIKTDVYVVCVQCIMKDAPESILRLPLNGTCRILVMLAVTVPVSAIPAYLNALSDIFPGLDTRDFLSHLLSVGQAWYHSRDPLAKGLACKFQLPETDMHALVHSKLRLALDYIKTNFGRRGDGNESRMSNVENDLVEELESMLVSIGCK